MTTTRQALLAFLLGFQTVAWSQGVAPIPKPMPPGEPTPYGVMYVQVLKGGNPQPGIWVTLQPVAPNGLPNAKGTARRTDEKGETSIPLVKPLRGLLLVLLDQPENFRLQIPLDQILGSWTLGPYRLEVRVALP